MSTKNPWLYSLSRLIRGHQPVFLEYAVDMSPRWPEPEGNPHLEKVFKANKTTIEHEIANLASMEPVVEALEAGELEPLKFNWRNGYLPALDALSVMHAAANATNTYFEIGSGNSTIAARAAVQHTGASTKIISVDPQPRIEVDVVCDEIIRDRFENLDFGRIAELGPGDVLFVDSSHRCFMGSDVTVLFTEVIPMLAPGVLFGIHDIMLPFDYPARWTKRAFSEQYLLAALLIGNPEYFEIKLANRWSAVRGLHREPLNSIWDRFDQDICDRGGSAFWGIKR